jgi:hypothetical protein
MVKSALAHFDKVRILGYGFIVAEKSHLRATFEACQATQSSAATTSLKGKADATENKLLENQTTSHRYGESTAIGLNRSSLTEWEDRRVKSDRTGAHYRFLGLCSVMRVNKTSQHLSRSGILTAYSYIPV